MVSHKALTTVLSVFAMTAMATAEPEFTDSLNQGKNENTITNFPPAPTQEPYYIRPQVITEDAPSFTSTTLATRTRDFSSSSPKLPHMTIGSLPGPKGRGSSDANGKTGLAPGQYRPYMVDHSRGFKLDNRTSNDTNTQGTKHVPWGFFSAKNETTSGTTDLSNKNVTVTSSAAASGPQNNVTTITVTEVNTSGNQTNATAEIEKSLKEFLHEVELMEKLAQEELTLAPEDDEHLEEEAFGNSATGSTKTIPFTPQTAGDGISLEDVFQTCDNHPSPESFAACSCVLTGFFRDDEIALVDAECFQTLSQKYENLFISDLDPAILLHKREWVDEIPHGDIFCPVTINLDQPELIDDCFPKNEVAYIQNFQSQRERNNEKTLHRRDQDTSSDFPECQPLPLHKRNLDSPALHHQVRDFVGRLSYEELVQFLMELDAQYSAAEKAQPKPRKRDLEELDRYAQTGDEEVEKLVEQLNEDELMELTQLLEEAGIQK